MIRVAVFIAAVLFAGSARADVGLLLLGANSPPHYSLDGLPTVTGAYSLRRLLTSYSTNKLIRLRRASDSTESDIGFLSNGFIDTPTASTFCNATTCFVRTWYDQSGGGRDLVQLTTASQPAFAFNCLGSKPCFQTTTTQSVATAANVTPASGLVSFNSVANRAAGTAQCTLMRENGANNRWFTSASILFWSITGGTSGSFGGGATDAAWHSGNSVVNGASSVVGIDGTDTTGTATGNTTAGAAFIGGSASTTCNILENAFFDNVALSATQRLQIAKEQKASWQY